MGSLTDEKIPLQMLGYNVSLTIEQFFVEGEHTRYAAITPGKPLELCNTVTPCDICVAVLGAFSAADNDETFGRDFVNARIYISCGKIERLFRQFRPFRDGVLCLVKKRRSLMDTNKEYAREKIGIVLVRHVYMGRPVGIGRTLSDFIDLEIIRRWRDTCDRQHKGQCSAHLVGVASIHLPWLIDTYDQCIVPYIRTSATSR